MLPFTNFRTLVGPNTTNIMVGNGVYLDPFNDHSTTITITRQSVATTAVRAGETDTGAAAAAITSGVVTPDTAINVDTASPVQAYALPTVTA